MEAGSFHLLPLSFFFPSLMPSALISTSFPSLPFLNYAGVLTIMTYYHIFMTYCVAIIAKFSYERNTCMYFSRQSYNMLM